MSFLKQFISWFIFLYYSHLWNIEACDDCQLSLSNISSVILTHNTTGKYSNFFDNSFTTGVNFTCGTAPTISINLTGLYTIEAITIVFGTGSSYPNPFYVRGVLSNGSNDNILSGESFFATNNGWIISSLNARYKGLYIVFDYDLTQCILSIVEIQIYGTFVTQAPTSVPTKIPTKIPTSVPTNLPTKFPTHVPTSVPTIDLCKDRYVYQNCCSSGNYTVGNTYYNILTGQYVLDSEYSTKCYATYYNTSCCGNSSAVTTVNIGSGKYNLTCNGDDNDQKVCNITRGYSLLFSNYSSYWGNGIVGLSGNKSSSSYATTPTNYFCGCNYVFNVCQLYNNTVTCNNAVRPNDTNVCSEDVFIGEVSNFYDTDIVSNKTSQSCKCQYLVDTCEAQYVNDFDPCTIQEIRKCCGNNSALVTHEFDSNGNINWYCNNTNKDDVCTDPYNDRYKINITEYFSWWYDGNISSYVMHNCECSFLWDNCTYPTSVPTASPSTPTLQPTFIPTKMPTFNPTLSPTMVPTSNPTIKNITEATGEPKKNGGGDTLAVAGVELTTVLLGIIGGAILLFILLIIVMCAYLKKCLCFKNSGKKNQEEEEGGGGGGTSPSGNKKKEAIIDSNNQEIALATTVTKPNNTQSNDIIQNTNTMPPVPSSPKPTQYPQWAACQACSKWRIVLVPVDEIENWTQPPNWQCSMNTSNPNYASCDAPQESPTKAKYGVEGLRHLNKQREREALKSQQQAQTTTNNEEYHEL